MSGDRGPPPSTRRWCSAGSGMGVSVGGGLVVIVGRGGLRMGCTARSWALMSALLCAVPRVGRLGMALHRTGRLAEAREAYEEALDSGHEVVKPRQEAVRGRSG